MNNKNAINNSQQYKLPIIAQIAPAAVLAKITASVEQNKGPYQCDAFSALIARCGTNVVSTQTLPGSTWRWIKQRQGSNNGRSPAPPDLEFGACDNRSFRLTPPRMPNLPSYATFHSTASRQKTVNRRSVILILLYLLSPDVVAPQVDALSKSELLISGVSSSFTNATSSSQALLSRSIRTHKVLTDELEILVRTTKHGFFKGRIMSSDNDGVSSRTNDISDASVIGFLGIRYASAPTKRLRFMPPTAYHYASNQVHDMQTFGPICRQRLPIDFRYSAQQSDREYEPAKVVQQHHSSELHNQDAAPGMTDSDLHIRLIAKMMSRESFQYFRPLFKKLVVREQSEDCLNLNIYVPKEALANASGQNQPRPVLVIIHGESFDYGAGSTINGFKFVQQTRLIIITFNYRLNILGFPPKLPGASRGNLGLMDQVAALHWIKDNVGSFGGSPNNITLMGTKRAAIFVNLLMLSPLAKGLFQRAIMEDGSALTPIVANHIISPTGPYAYSSNQHNLPAIQHVRFLAKLCDCPVYQRVTKLHTNGSSHQYNIATISGIDIQLQQQSSVADEIKANALTFECLRHKPIEQIMQLVPLDLLQFNQANGELSIASRWLRAILSSQVDSGSTEMRASVSEDLISVDARIIERLVLAAIKEQLERDRTTYEDRNEKLRVSELFGALYAPSSSSVRPLFGPVEDGTIVPEEDIATEMLKVGSTFAQRDLLIGLSQPVISTYPVEGLSDKMTSNDQHELNSNLFELGPNHILVDRITAFMQQVGLTNEQAVAFVNVFVRSFYRYHNQEITNSIINHYLSDGRVARARKLGALRTNLRGQDEEISLKESKISQQQLFVLDSLLEAFQDALINVPLFKTGLIHAIKQLDSLVEVFIGQQFEKWKQNAEQLSGESQTQMNELQDSFTSFAQSLFNDTNWPLELHSPSNLAVQQPKATYLYQFDSFAPLERIQKLIDEITGKSSVSFGWKSVKESLETILVKLQDSGLWRRMGFECIMQSESDDETYSENDDRGQYIVKKFSNWLCSKYANILKAFIYTGNVNNLNYKRDGRLSQGDSLGIKSMSEKIVQLDSMCQSLNQHPQTADHHSVQVAGSENLVINVTGSCRRELNSIVYDYLLSEFEILERPNMSWTVFNIFTQHVATIPAKKDLWNIGSISDGELSPSYDQKSTFSAKSSFWANYVPALNCTKTQPVIPTSLLSSSLVGSPNANSSLLNMNLLFSCQYGGKTSYEVFESLTKSIKHQLQAKLAHWRLSLANLVAGQQNHHSLRMANIGQTSSPDESLDQQEHLNSGESSRLNLTIQNDSRSPNEFNEANGNKTGNHVIEMRSRYVGTVLIFCALVVSITLASGACAVIKQRKQKRDKKCEMETPINLDVRAPQICQAQDPGTLNSYEQLENSSSFDHTENHATHATQKINQPILTDAREMIADQSQSLEFNLHESSSIQMNHVCALDSQSGYIYCDDGQGGILENPVAFCRSHLSFNVSNEGNIIDDGNYHATQRQLDLTQIDQEPIMMPILTSAPQDVDPHQHQSQTSSLRKTGYLANSSTVNGVHGDSSSETQDHSRLSTSKKRVKISDPLGSSRSRTSKSTESSSNHHVLSRNIEGHVIVNDPLHCPVHRDQAAITMSQLDTGYYVDDRGLIATKDELWNGNQINLIESDQYVPTMDASNCDHYVAYKGNSQQHIPYDAHLGHKNTSSYNNSNYSTDHNILTVKNGYRNAANSYQSPSSYEYQHK